MHYKEILIDVEQVTELCREEERSAWEESEQLCLGRVLVYLDPVEDFWTAYDMEEVIDFVLSALLSW